MRGHGFCGQMLGIHKVQVIEKVRSRLIGAVNEAIVILMKFVSFREFFAILENEMLSVLIP